MHEFMAGPCSCKTCIVVTIADHRRAARNRGAETTNKTGMDSESGLPKTKVLPAAAVEHADSCPGSRIFACPVHFDDDWIAGLTGSGSGNITPMA